MKFEQEMVDRLWQKARGTTELSVEIWRKDECGAWIRRDHYGSAQSEFGWKVENVSAGGADTLENLRPFHHANGYDRANRHAVCRMTADQKDMPVMEHVREPRNRAA